MKKLVLLLSFLSLNQNVNALTYNGHVSGSIIDGISVIINKELDFGLININDNSGTITMNTTGVLSCDPNYDCSIPGIPSEIRIVKSGSNSLDSNFNIEFTDTYLTDKNNSNNKILLSIPSSLINYNTTSNDSNSIATINTGGTLSISNNQPSGQYIGYIPITITY